MKNHPLVRQANAIMLCVWILVGAACAGLTIQQVADTSLQIAQQVYALASGYYAINAPAMTPENTALFKKYLDGFALALETGQGLNGFVQRWYQFLQGY